MPLVDLVCDQCGYARFDKYFPTQRALHATQRCPKCRTALRRLASNVVIHDFVPFTHMTKDGRTHRLSSRKRMHDMMRAYGLEHSPYNDSVEAKADPREFKKCMAEEKKAFPERYRKLKSKVKIATAEQVAPLARRAQETKFETARI